MKVTRIEDRIFEKECPTCKALLEYQMSDIVSETITIAAYMGNALPKGINPDIPIVLQQLICPVCGTRIQIKRMPLREVQYEL